MDRQLLGGLRLRQHHTWQDADVPVTLGTDLGLARLLKPCVLVRSVVDDEIEDELDTASVALLDELVHVSDGAVGRVDES